MGIACQEKKDYIVQCMNHVMEYQNFRLYVRDYYAEHKVRSGFTWRDFAKAAGYSSPVFLKLVCDGKTNLSEVGVERVANAMGLVGTDLLYFRTLVSFNQEKDSNKKKEIFKELRELAKENSLTLVGEDQYDYYESWINPALREMVPQIPDATPAQMADLLAFDTQAAEVKKALQLLQKVGLLKKDANGKYEQAAKAITTGNIEVTSLAVREMHRQMGELAIRSLDEVPVKERDVSGMTFAASENAFYRISKEIEDFRRRVTSIVMEDSGEDRVYRMNVQFFPLTKNLKKGGKNV